MNPLDIAKPLIERGARITTSVVGAAFGLVGKLQSRGGGQAPASQPQPMTDPTLKTKVESTIFRQPGIEKAKIDVTVADGVVSLHGEVRNQATMQSLETAVRAIPEVKGLESELHLPKTPAPSTPKAGQRKQAKPKATAQPGKRAERFNRDKTGTAEVAEPTPIELAKQRKGRQAAPLGSKDTKASGSGSSKATRTRSTSSAKPAEAPKSDAGTRRANRRTSTKTQAASPVKEVAGSGATTKES